MTEDTTTPDGTDDKPKRRPHKPGDTLSGEQRRKLIKPLRNYEELIDKALVAWLSLGNLLKMTGLTRAKLAALVKKARREQVRETKIVTAAELKIARAMDARLLGDSLAYRGLLDLHAAAKAGGRRSQEVAKAFEFLAKALGAK